MSVLDRLQAIAESDAPNNDLTPPLRFSYKEIREHVVFIYDKTELAEHRKRGREATRERLAHARALVDALNSDIETFRARVASLEAERAELRTRVERAQARAAELERRKDAQTQSTQKGKPPQGGTGVTEGPAKGASRVFDGRGWRKYEATPEQMRNAMFASCRDEVHSEGKENGCTTCPWRKWC